MSENQSHAGNQLYDDKFYRAQKDDSFISAKIVLPIVEKVVHPRNVIDIGCGVGTWLAAWKNLFGVKIYGVDGDYVDRSQLFIDEKDFYPLNLEKRGGVSDLFVDKKFDLVESLEVAEHLSPERADSFVEDLTKLGDIILFSAAIIGQTGTNHVNEQMQSYWAKKFLSLGYVGIDCIRSKIWNYQQVVTCYRQNTFLYVNSKELYRYPELHKFYLENGDNIIYDIVHPENWINRLMYFQNTVQQFNAYLEQIQKK